MTPGLTFSIAESADAAQLADLINSAYRGESSKQGWTTEAHLLHGRRTDTDDIRHLIATDDSIMMLCKAGEELLGSVHLQKSGGHVQLSMLAVSPPRQGLGIGKRLLDTAESTARQTWQIDRLVMAVIPCRHELIAFYERRGYRRTGICLPFPVSNSLWTPKVAGLRLELLEKILQ